jgi:hypothetical protein
VEKGSNSPLKVLLAVIKPNEKMRCKEYQFRVHMNYKALVWSKYWELLLLITTFFCLKAVTVMPWGNLSLHKTYLTPPSSFIDRALEFFFFFITF